MRTELYHCDICKEEIKNPSERQNIKLTSTQGHAHMQSVFSEVCQKCVNRIVEYINTQLKITK